MLWQCAHCFKDFEEDDGELRDDDFICFDCMELDRIEFESNQRDKKLDDPRRGQGTR